VSAHSTATPSHCCACKAKRLLTVGWHLRLRCAALHCTALHCRCLAHLRWIVSPLRALGALAQLLSTSLTLQLTESLYVGGELAALNWETISAARISHVVNCSAASVCNAHEDRGLKYLPIHLDDLPSQARSLWVPWGTLRPIAVLRRRIDRTVRYSLSRTKPSHTAGQPNRAVVTHWCRTSCAWCMRYSSSSIRRSRAAVASSSTAGLSVCLQRRAAARLATYNMRESHAKSGWLSILVSGRLARHWCCCVPGCSSAQCTLRVAGCHAFGFSLLRWMYCKHAAIPSYNHVLAVPTVATVRTPNPLG
jgi:hypothetical protein